MAMVALEVYRKTVRWPEGFALFMIKHYQDHQVPVMVHMVCSSSGRDGSAYDSLAPYAARAGSGVHFCCHEF